MHRTVLLDLYNHALWSGVNLASDCIPHVAKIGTSKFCNLHRSFSDLMLARLDHFLNRCSLYHSMGFDLTVDWRSIFLQ